MITSIRGTLDYTASSGVAVYLQPFCIRAEVLDRKQTGFRESRPAAKEDLKQVQSSCAVESDFRLIHLIDLA